MLHLFVNHLCACALFVCRAAGVPLQAQQLLCADGECCPHSDSGPWCPASSDPTWSAYTGMKAFKLHRDGTNGVFWGALIITVVERLIFKQSSLHPFFHKPLLRIVSIDGGWKSLSVHDPASAGSCFFFLSAFRPSSTVHCSLPLALPPPLSLLLLSPPLPCSPGG